MTEQTQAEKLASKFMAKLTVYAPSKADPIDELHWKEAESWLAKAINQATAELRAENERLKDDLLKMNEAVAESLDVQLALKGELDQTQAQVAALHQLVKKAGNAFQIDPDFHFDLHQAAKDTQATAEAYTAKVRREEREKLTKEFLEAARSELKIARDYTVAALQSLLPKTDEKGGAL